MKKRYFLTTLTALVAALFLSQASASGMTYDPVANYYNTYYGMDSLMSVNTSELDIKTEVKSSVPNVDPYDAYYNIFYEMAEEGQSTEESNSEPTLINNMEEPFNFYK